MAHRSVDVDWLLIDDRTHGLFRVNRAAFTDHDVFEQERREIFSRCWLYAGHASEVPRPGDFVTRNIGGRPMLLVHDTGGTIRAFMNTCTHRGNTVERSRAGNTKLFTCFYHAWSFSTQGELVGLPGEDAYSDAFDRKAMGLVPAPRFENYRGMLFVCFDRDAPTLADYLGPRAQAQVDYFLDSGSESLAIARGAQSYSMKANWKLLVENSIDGYHGMPTHQRYFRNYLSDIGVQGNFPTGDRPDTAGISLGLGHAVTEKPKHRTPLMAAFEAELGARRQALEARLGAERAALTADFDRNVFIFPNLILISTWRTIRTFYPLAPDYMEIDAWALMPTDESGELQQKRLNNFIGFLGPGGFGTPDDVAGLEGCQRGFAAQQEAGWSDLSRGMKRASPQLTDELQMRAFWRRWAGLMRGERDFDDCGDAPAPAAGIGTRQLTSGTSTGG